MGIETRYEEGRRVGMISLTINILLAVLKIVVGGLFASQALLADGFHSVSDIASTVIVLISIKVSQTPPDDDHPYGHGKAEPIATIVLGLFLLGTGLGLIRNAGLNILSNQVAIPGQLVIWAALFSVLAKEGLYHYTLRVGQRIDSKSLIADAHHHRSDVFSSIAALIGAGGARLGVEILDPIAGLIVALLIVKVGGEILKEAVDELMDAVPNKEKLNKIQEQVQQLKQVIEVGEIKLRPYGHYLYVDLAVVVSDDLTVGEGHKVAVKVKEKVKNAHPKVGEVMVHIDPASAYYQKDNKQENQA